MTAEEIIEEARLLAELNAEDVEPCDIAVDGREMAVKNPGMAMYAGMAFLTEDRKESGCFLLLDIMANMQMALLRHGHARIAAIAESKITAGEIGVEDTIRITREDTGARAIAAD